MIDYRTLHVWQCIAEYAGAHNTSVTISTICASCVDRAGMNGAWMALGNPPQNRVYATDPVAERVADLHFLLGQGPGVDAVCDGRPVSVPDLASVASCRAWPAFTAPAQATGVRSLVTVPLRIGDVVIGLFGMYSYDPVALSGEGQGEVVLFADIAVGLLLDRQPPSHEDAAGRRAAEAAVHQASGIISAQLGIDVAESVDRLRAHAFAHGRPLLEIAGEVVAGRIRFQPFPETGPDNPPNS